MITKITLQNVASYKEQAILETDKPINLVYGLNGAGKTQVTNFLQNQGQEKFKNCAIDGLNDEKILVYNQNFVETNFYAEDKQKGIFTLAKENIEVEKEIEQKQKYLNDLKENLKSKDDDIKKYNDDLLVNENNIAEKVWEIKTKYQNDFGSFFVGHIKDKKTFADYFISTIFSNNNYRQQANITIDELKNRYTKLNDENISKFEAIPLINIDEILAIERENIFDEVIVGSDDSILASLINKIGNADWVRQGEQYIEQSNNKCPFCQNDITDDFKKHLKEFFNDEYERNVKIIKELKERYNGLLKNIPLMETFFRGDILEDKNSEFELLYKNLLQNINNNLMLMSKKIEKPKEQISITSSQETLDKLNQFWQKVCLEFKGYVESFLASKEKIENENKNLNKAINEIQKRIKETQINIAKLQQKSVNIDGAIDSINGYLKELGIVDFYIKKDGQSDKCVIVRGESNKPCFQTLSEGEKTLIAFLYFLQLCQGKEDKNEIDLKKIIVIDDPISSLSYNYVFDIAQLIKNIFFDNSKDYIRQIFIFTHHLYFFHELIGYKENYESKIKMFRVYKGENNQSCIETIERTSIFNEYEAYWQILRDCKKNGANKYIIPNVMRNVLEYFLGFVKQSKIDIIKTLADSENGTQYKAFYRYINRESHSLMSNVVYEKDFDEKIFFEAFEKVFELIGHTEHYKTMIEENKI